MPIRCPSLLLAVALAAAAETAPAPVFTDERAELAVAGSGRVAFSQRLLDRRGWGEARAGEAEVRDGRIAVAPLGEGINAITVAGREVRFLAMDPPAALDRAALLAALPRSGTRLLAGGDFTVLAMGDSVTDTGDYPALFARLLARASGNPHVTAVKHAYPGRSADATARNFARDTAGPVDLGLLMYGLNDQACFVPLDAVLEHYRFVAAGLAGRGADTVFLQPGPHIDIPLSEAERKPDSPPPWSAFRTIGFAEALRPLAGELHAPLAETFAALWGGGGDGIAASVRAMWPVYPLSYSRQLTSLAEADGHGDTIHPNALGHLAIARACLAALAGPAPAGPLAFAGSSRWTAAGVRSEITVTNTGADERSGRLELYPELRGELTVERPIAYRLAPGASLAIPVAWPQARVPEDLLRFPNERYLAPGRPLIPLLDVSGGGSAVHAVPAPFVHAATFVRGRSTCAQPVAAVALRSDAGEQRLDVPFPAGDVGRVPLVRQVGEAWAVAELAYVRYAGAVRGDSVADGDLGEWGGAVWSPLGEPCQARFACGPEDHRADPAECRLQWSCRAGRDGLVLALRGSGDLRQDRFTVFLDPRQPQLLGTVGRYYWLSGSLAADGALKLGPGETSPRGVRLEGRWKADGEGTALEIAVPWALCEQAGWPESGDLGIALWWTHRGADGATTHIQWSEDGHPWNPRWYGVVRLQERPDHDALPWMVRVR